MVSAGDIFLNATDLRNCTHNYLIIHTEARDIEDIILFAADNGLFQAIVSNTPLTNTVLPPVQNITTINLLTSTFVLANHGYQTGDQVEFSTSGNLPAPLMPGVIYYVIFVDANSFKVATSAQNAIYNNPIVLTSAAQTVAIGTIQNPVFTPATTMIIDGQTVALSGTTLSQTINDINFVAIPNIIASQQNGSLVITDTTGALITITGVAATAAGMPASTPAAVIGVQAISLAEEAYNAWQGITTDAQKTYIMDQVITHFQNLGYTITRQQNPNVPEVFQWVISW